MVNCLPRARTKHEVGGLLSLAEEALPRQGRAVATVMPVQGAEVLASNCLRLDKVNCLQYRVVQLDFTPEI